MIRSTAVALLAAALAAPAFAQSPWYAGISAGQSLTDDELVRNRESTITLGTDFATDFDDKDGAWKATLGWRLGPMLSVEVNYADLGGHGTVTTFLGGDPLLPAAIAIRREITAYGADVVLRAPIGDRFAIFGRAGAARARLAASAVLFGNVEFTGGAGERERSTRVEETVGRFGVGVQWDFAPNLGLRAEWERYADVGKAFRVGGTGTTGEADTDMVCAGLILRF